MSNPVPNSLLRFAVSPPSAQTPQRAADDKRAAGDASANDGFSRALERRMSPPARPPQERAAAPAGGRPPAADRPRAAEPREPRNAETARAAGDADTRLERPADDEAASEAAASAGTATNGPGAAGAVASAAETAASETQTAIAEETPAAVAPDPAQAASLAALLPGVAALPAAIAGHEGDAQLPDGPLLASEARSPGAAALERLIAEAGGKTASAAGKDQAATDFEVPLAPSDNRDGKGRELAVAVEIQPPADGARQALAELPPPAAPALEPVPPATQSAGLHATALVSSARAGETPLPQLPVPTPAGDRVWAEDVGNRLMWLVGRHESKAELVLTPAHLGKLEVSLQVSGDQTTAHFVAASAAARDALEQALPRLREVLQQAGITLGEANVSTASDQRAQQERGRDPARPEPGADVSAGGGETLPMTSAATSWTRAARGVVDTFA